MHERLKPFHEDLLQSPREVAWEMMMSRDFQNCKLHYGRNNYCDEEVFRMKVPGLYVSINEPKIGVGGGQMAFTW